MLKKSCSYMYIPGYIKLLFSKYYFFNMSINYQLPIKIVCIQNKIQRYIKAEFTKTIINIC